MINAITYAQYKSMLATFISNTCLNISNYAAISGNGLYNGNSHTLATFGGSTDQGVISVRSLSSFSAASAADVIDKLSWIDEFANKNIASTNISSSDWLSLIKLTHGFIRSELLLVVSAFTSDRFYYFRNTAFSISSTDRATYASSELITADKVNSELVISSFKINTLSANYGVTYNRGSGEKTNIDIYS